MPGQHVGQRFGQDSYARITTTAEVTLEASEMLPYEPMYQPLVPFLPPSITSGTAGGSSLLGSVTSSGDDDADWKSYPDRLDLHWYQGDDVQIPLYFQNPGDPALDMSNENDWEWKAEMRLTHRYHSAQVNEFSIESEAVAPTPPSVEPTGITKVTLYLPGKYNPYWGVWAWDLVSTSPFEGPVFPKPPDFATEEPWPPTTQTKTWLYGYVYVAPRVTQTDWLPWPADSAPAGVPIAVTPTFAGPNGRVP